jgi:hypothetical protein
MSLSTNQMERIKKNRIEALKRLERSSKKDIEISRLEFKNNGMKKYLNYGFTKDDLLRIQSGKNLSFCDPNAPKETLIDVAKAEFLRLYQTHFHPEIPLQSFSHGVLDIDVFRIMKLKQDALIELNKEGRCLISNCPNCNKYQRLFKIPNSDQLICDYCYFQHTW